SAGVQFGPYLDEPRRGYSYGQGQLGFTSIEMDGAVGDDRLVNRQAQLRIDGLDGLKIELDVDTVAHTGQAGRIDRVDDRLRPLTIGRHGERHVRDGHASRERVERWRATGLPAVSQQNDLGELAWIAQEDAAR